MAQPKGQQHIETATLGNDGYIWWLKSVVLVQDKKEKNIALTSNRLCPLNTRVTSLKAEGTGRVGRIGLPGTL